MDQGLSAEGLVSVFTNANEDVKTEAADSASTTQLRALEYGSHDVTELKVKTRADDKKERHVKALHDMTTRIQVFKINISVWPEKDVFFSRDVTEFLV